MHNGHRVSSI